MERLAHLEGESARVLTTTRLATSEWMTARRGETTTPAAVHHIEEDVGVNVDMGAIHATHTSHSSHSTHTAHATEAAATAEHVSRVDQVISIVVGSAFPDL